MPRLRVALGLLLAATTASTAELKLRILETTDVHMSLVDYD